MNKRSDYFHESCENKKSILGKVLDKNRLIAVAMLASMTFASPDVYANDIDSEAKSARMTLVVKNQTVSSVLKKIRENSDVELFYNNNNIDLSRKVNVSVKNGSVYDVLDEVFAGTNVKYSNVDGKIVLSTKAASKSVNQASKSKIKGTVVDAKGESIIGATVQEVGTNNGSITDIDGNFEINTKKKEATFVVSYIGYKTQKLVLQAGKANKIVLQEDSKTLDEVVVVGYGTQKKVNLTGSVESIGGEKLQSRPVPNLSQALQGNVTGANFSVGNNGFEPGADMTFQIRGQGSAYVLVDGVESDLSKVNPNDIENISVLKDAAAASIYGAKASYGVVLITTKSGKANSKPTVSFSSNISLSKNTRMPSMPDSYTVARALNEAGNNQGGAPYKDSTIDRILQYQAGEITDQTYANGNSWWDTNNANANNDWFDLYFGTAVNNQENISVRGGGAKTTYYLSAGHVYNGSTLKLGTDYYRRYNTNVKVKTKVTDWWDFSFNNKFAKSSRVRPIISGQDNYSQLFHNMAKNLPSQYSETPDGKNNYKESFANGGNVYDDTYDFSQQFATELRPFKGMTINADYSLRFTNEAYECDGFTNYKTLVDGTKVASGAIPSYITKNHSNRIFNSFNAYATYKFNFGKNNFTVMAGTQHEKQNKEGIAGKKYDILTSAVPSVSTTTGSIASFYDDLSHFYRIGNFARINYNYNDLYLLELNGRYDGTSIFASGNRWGFFPSVSLGWNVSHEKFFKKFNNVVNTFKLRASYGSLGNQNVTAYQDLALMNIKTNLGWIMDGARPSYVTAPNLVNPDLTWEKSNTVNFGLDLAFLNNRLKFTGDIYQRNTFDKLGPAESLPSVLGQTIPQKNNAELRTNGWEISLSWRDKLTKDLSYNVAATLFDYTTEVTKYNNPTMTLNNYYKGYKYGTIWGYTSYRLIESAEEAAEIVASGAQKKFNAKWNAGDVKYEDLTGDGIVNDGKNTLYDHGDLSIIGNTTPRYQFTFNLGVQYKDFDISAFIQGVGKRDVFFPQQDGYFWGFIKTAQHSVFKTHLDYYRDQEATKYSGLGVNTNAYYPRPYCDEGQNNKNRKTSTRYLQDASYMRLKNVQVGYNIPKMLLSKIKLSSARVYFSGDNLGLLTNNFPKHMDPEIATAGFNGQGGKSMGAQTSYSFGIDVEF